MVWIWLGVMAVSAFVEAATLTLVSIWFAAGALVATFAAYAGASLTVQLILFVGVSIAACVAVRPLARRFVAPNVVPTNADRLLGAEARVTEEIDNAAPSGAVYVDGKTWTARSSGGERIPAGELVEIERMEGVKLIVRPRAAAAVS
ncbi:MAG: NfeD family protein [Oscillospiraceae bacterium]|nr:NfeD family protein [Oscillospiraceae bacterium]